MFNPGSFDDSIPRKGGVFDLVNEEEQDLESIAAAMDLSQDLSPGKFGVYYETKRPTKNELEREWLTDARSTRSVTSANETSSVSVSLPCARSYGDRNLISSKKRSFRSLFFTVLRSPYWISIPLLA